ncbi:ARM-like repeat-containing protein [Diplocarpon rosae]|nr:ARM-like repeat-containing protein [Diplocarpon rosae]
MRNRTNPTAKSLADPELAAIREQRILPVLNDLQSSDLKIRSAAARAITNIIEDQKSRKLLLREQIVRIIFEQTLTDSSLETRTDGWGILRNLSLEEEADFCVHLYRQDILTAIEGVIRTIVHTIDSKDSSFTKLPPTQQQLLWNLTRSIISLINSLAESQDEIAEAITKLATVTNFLFGLLTFADTPSQIQNEVLSCLTALTEDNKLLDQQIVDKEDWLKGLIRIKDAENINSVAACGVLHNVFVTMQWFDHNTPVEGVSDSMLIPTLVNYMEHAQPQSNGTNVHTNSSSPDQVLQLALDITASIATSLQEALEHGSRNEKEFTGFDESVNDDVDEMNLVDDDAEVKDDDISDEMNQDEIDAEMQMVLGDGSDDEDDSSGDEITLDRLVRLAAPKLLTLAHPKKDSNDPIQEHALSALNNVAWTISSIDFSTGHLNSLQKFWASLSQKTWDEVISPVLASNTADIKLASSITSLAWAVSRSVKGAVAIKPEEQRKFMALYQASKGLDGAKNGQQKAEDESDAFQSLGVKCIGVLGSIALDPAPVELNREIGIFLLSILSALPDVPAADTVEALNQIFDIYSDKVYSFDEPVFWGDNFSKHLEDIQPKAKKLAKSIDKRKFGELRSRADEAVLNLGRFLIYKRKERANKDYD